MFEPRQKLFITPCVKKVCIVYLPHVKLFVRWGVGTCMICMILWYLDIHSCPIPYQLKLLGIIGRAATQAVWVRLRANRFGSG